MTKADIIFLFSIFYILFLSSLIIAQNYKIDVSTAKGTFEAGEKITLKVSLFDSANKPVNDNVNIILEDAEKKVKRMETIPSNQFVDVDLGEEATYGFWNIKATYQGVEATSLFSVEKNQIARFELVNDKLVITNIGNIKYSKNVQILIGDTIISKNINLNVGETGSFRLVAPEGNYNIKVIVDGKTALTRTDVQLTGNVVSALDEKAGQPSGITGTLSPGKNSEGELLSYFKDNKFIYIFVLVIFSAMILLAIERHYNQKARG